MYYVGQLNKEGTIQSELYRTIYIELILTI